MNATLPLFSSVPTSVPPSPSTRARRPAIGTRFAVPTFTPRSSAAYLMLPSRRYLYDTTLRSVKGYAAALRLSVTTTRISVATGSSRSRSRSFHQYPS